MLGVCGYKIFTSRKWKNPKVMTPSVAINLKIKVLRLHVAAQVHIRKDTCSGWAAAGRLPPYRKLPPHVKKREIKTKESRRHDPAGISQPQNQRPSINTMCHRLRRYRRQQMFGVGRRRDGCNSCLRRTVHARLACYPSTSESSLDMYDICHRPSMYRQRKFWSEWMRACTTLCLHKTAYVQLGMLSINFRIEIVGYQHMSAPEYVKEILVDWNGLQIGCARPMSAI